MSDKADAVREWLQALDARQLSRAMDEVQRTVTLRVFEGMATGQDVDDELIAGELLRAWLRDQM